MILDHMLHFWFLAKLNSCLEEMRSILEETSEMVLVEAAISAQFNPEKALNAVLNKQGKAMHLQH